ncbi:hypothetical protein STRCI_008176 [Streptomyces cinnabarinus]|uniref:Uncharacterized protein n=1 Tax=Streptomyces cinnabarinus TaxID=67287 RepID=A0ABY7KPT0_9ACTN|nr:hypothetical protein [Streptomyces cinnabarinus]WAZ26582.1 hypothetical protein STRCI_008176 [Streptomyces cinnabarinus]
MDRLPIARYSYTDTETATIESAEQILTQRCLHSFGIDYEPPQQDTRSPAPADRRYGLASADEAARLGYHPDLGPLPEAPGLTDEELRVFYGSRQADPAGGERIVYKGKEVPARGCLGQSVAKLAKYDHPQAAQIARRISTQSYEDALTEPSVQKGFGAWSACMEEAGFRYASPLQPLNDKAFKGEDVSAKEKQTAAADVGCKEETGLLDIWFKAESALQQADIDKNTAVLKELRTAHRQRVEAARRVVAAG